MYVSIAVRTASGERRGVCLSSGWPDRVRGTRSTRPRCTLLVRPAGGGKKDSTPLGVPRATLRRVTYTYSVQRDTVVRGLCVRTRGFDIHICIVYWCILIVKRSCIFFSYFCGNRLVS